TTSKTPLRPLLFATLSSPRSTSRRGKRWRSTCGWCTSCYLRKGPLELTGK
ncbi:hypothetical protein KUCAC02_029645, partial [Chaenocephalus aceratus]